MKNNILYLILIFTTICSQNILSQIPNAIKSYESKDGKTIKLLPNNRVLIEETEKVEYPNRPYIISTTRDGKKICGTRISYVLHQSYGIYEYVGQNLTLSFNDENPIEKIDMRTIVEQPNGKEIIIRIIKNAETTYDLSIYQNDNLVCIVPPFEDNWKFTIKNIESPLILKYNNYIKNIKLNSDENTELIVTINDLKANNQIKNEKLVYQIYELIEK